MVSATATTDAGAYVDAGAMTRVALCGVRGNCFEC